MTRAQRIAPRIRELQATGLSFRQIAAVLKQEGVFTASGGKWRGDTVSDTLTAAEGGKMTAPPQKPQRPKPGERIKLVPDDEEPDDYPPGRPRTRII